MLALLMTQAKSKEGSTGGDITHSLPWLTGPALQYAKRSGDRPIISQPRSRLYRSALGVVQRINLGMGSHHS